MQIATRYLLPELAGTRLSPKLHKCISEAFVAKFGEYAGWAQNVLFIGELSSQKATLEPCSGTLRETKSAIGRKRGTKKVVANTPSGSDISVKVI